MDLKYDLDLGQGHWLLWTQAHERYEPCEYRGKPGFWRADESSPMVKVGAILTHRREDGGLCEGMLRFRLTVPEQSDSRAHVVWQFDGDYAAPTFSPSFLCYCKLCHGFIQAGRWVGAGCRHPS